MGRWEWAWEMKSTVVFLITVTFGITISFVLFNQENPMAWSFVLWLHGQGDSGPANEPIKTLFTSPQFSKTKWSFPSAPPVTCNYEGSVLKAVQNIHVDKEIAAGINRSYVFVCGFSQGGALTLASVLLYPKSLGACAVFSGWVPFNSRTCYTRSKEGYFLLASHFLSIPFCPCVPCVFL